MAEEFVRTVGNARMATQQRDPSLQWDCRSNRGTQRDGGHPCHLGKRIRKISTFVLELDSSDDV